MLEEYVAELAVARADLREVRDSLRGADAPGEAFHYPSVVADWGLDYFAAEARHTRKALDRLSSTPTRRNRDQQDALLVHDVARRLHGRPGRRHAVADQAPRAEPGRRGHRRRRSARCWWDVVPSAATTRTAAPTRRVRSVASGTGRRSCSPTSRRPSRCPTRRSSPTSRPACGCPRGGRGPLRQRPRRRRRPPVPRGRAARRDPGARRTRAARRRHPSLRLAGRPRVDLRLREFSESGGTANLWYDVLR